MRSGILIVDGSASVRRELRLALRGLAISSISEAADGGSALEAIATRAPDLVVADWDTPLLGGLDLARMLRESGSGLPACGAVMLIANRLDRAAVLAARDAGVVGMLLKPVPARLFRQRVSGLLARDPSANGTAA